MAQTVLEINTKTSDNKNLQGSYFSQVFGEPIKCAAGSTIDFLNGFLDLGTQSIDDYIFISEKFQLGINFYRYEYDIPQIPTTQGTDSNAHSKRFIYWYPAAVDVPDPFAESSIIDDKVTGPGYKPNPVTQYGNKSNLYGNTNLPSFLCQRTAQSVEPLPDGSNQRIDTFTAIEETAYVDVEPGYYSKVKFCQLVNDAFNLIQGSLTNSDKPLEIVTVGVPPAQNTVEPLDYQQFPNSTSPLLKAYEYPYDTAKVVGSDPNSISNETKIYTGDLTWPYWFIPVYTIPTDPNFFVAEENPPYVWYNSEQSGFMAGTSKFNLNYDTANDLFYIDYLHTPILDTQQREVVLFSKALINYSQRSNTGYKANGSMGGILISRLFSYAYDANGNAIQTNTNFWQSKLGFGFDDAYQTQFKADLLTKENSFFNNYRLDGSVQKPQLYGITYTFKSTYPNTKYLTNATTTALVPIQWLQQSNFAVATADKGMSIFSKDIPKIFQSIGSRVIYGDAAGYAKPSPYYLIDINISHLKNDNYRSRDSYHQIMSIAGKTYNSGTSFIQLFGDNSIQALNLEEDIYIDKIEVKILNPDKTLATGLGDTTTIFLRIIQPVIMEQNKIK